MSEDNISPDKTQNENKQIKKQSKLATFMAKPSVVLALAVFGILGTAFGIWSYFDSKSYPELTFSINPVRTVVVKSGQASRLATSFDNQIIQTDVTAAQVAIWNNGKRAVKNDEILKTVIIQTENAIPILEATIVNVTRDITKFSINTSEIQNGRLSVSWSILEQNDGAAVQIVYAGDTSVKLFGQGIIEGQPELKIAQNTILKPPGQVIGDLSKTLDKLSSGALIAMFLSVIGGMLAAHLSPRPKIPTEVFRVHFNNELKTYDDIISLINTPRKDEKKWDEVKRKVEQMKKLTQRHQVQNLENLEQDFSSFDATRRIINVMLVIIMVVLLLLIIYREYIQKIPLSPFGF
jgi:uncharacterized membrane protein YidH (DUF202 family)